MAKKTKAVATKTAEETKKGLGVTVSVTKNDKGRIEVEVTLLQDGQVIASDKDWVIL